jgi:hypothetical protein
MVRTRPRRWWLRLIGVLMVSGVGWVLYGQRVAGDMAPAFTLPSTTGGTVALDQYRGRQPVVLVFYLWRSALHTTRSGWRILQRLLIRRSSLPKTCPVPEQSTGMDCLWGTEGTRVPSHVFGLRGMASLRRKSLCYTHTSQRWDWH